VKSEAPSYVEKAKQYQIEYYKANRDKKIGFIRKLILNGGRDVSDLEVLCFNCNIRYEYVRGRSRLPSNWEEVLARLKA